MAKPKIRFNGYQDDWEQRKLFELTTMHARIGWQNLRTSEFLDSGDYMLITGTDFNDGAIDYSTCHYVEKERYEQDKNIQIRNGSILITKDGTLGKVAYVQGLTMPATLNAGVFNVEIKDENIADEKFLYQYLKAPFLMDYVSKKATGGTIKHLNQSILIDFPIAMPKKEEQVEIGNYFQSLDHLITLHQRKCDETKKLKKYMLQKMFPQNGKSVPEIRFSEFTDDWEQRKLGDVLERRIEQRQQSKEYPRLAFASGQGVIPLSERKTNNREQLTKDEYTKKYLVTELNDIVYNPANVKYGAIDRNKCGRGLISPIYVTFTTSEIPGFIERIVTSHDFQQRALRFEEGTVTKRQSVNPEDLVTLDILVASKREEQQKIATYFDSLDNLITLHQRKCDELQNIKKYMLQNMFV